MLDGSWGQEPGQGLTTVGNLFLVVYAGGSAFFTNQMGDPTVSE